MIKIIGYIAAILTTSAFIPQALKTIKTRQTKDLSLTMYIAFSSGLFLWFLYGIFLKDLPIILANGITLIFCLIILVLKIRHK
ncbi:MAG: SemiSWEET transporter [Candidatus Marinimicrobia bacterium]|nr:SemiSWEET transporter [Candidatus Neomarinimicrobiota bacterium]